MEWLALIDKALGTDFDKPQYDPAKGRNKLVRQIDLAAKQHNDGTTRAPNRAWRAGGLESNPAISFAPKIDGKPVLLNGEERVYVPASRFQDFLKALKKSVEAGDLDKEIKAALASEKPLVFPSGIGRAPRGSAKSKDKPWQVREGFAALEKSDKQSIAASYRRGRNPDQSSIEEVGHKPDAPIARAAK